MVGVVRVVRPRSRPIDRRVRRHGKGMAMADMGGCVAIITCTTDPTMYASCPRPPGPPSSSDEPAACAS